MGRYTNVQQLGNSHTSAHTHIDKETVTLNSAAYKGRFLSTTYVYSNLNSMLSFILRKDCCRSLHFPAVLYLFNPWPKPSWISFLAGLQHFLAFSHCFLAPSTSGKPLMSLSYLNHNTLIPLNEGPPLFLSSLHLRQTIDVSLLPEPQCSDSSLWRITTVS